MISGDMYSEASFHVNVDIFRIKRASPGVFIPSVPTKLLVLKCAIQVLVSIAGGYGRNKRNNWLNSICMVTQMEAIYIRY